MAAVLMGFGVWGNMAPIAGAVVASGVFVATGQNKIIQHLEGGVIREIYRARRRHGGGGADTCSNSMTPRREPNCGGCSCAASG